MTSRLKLPRLPNVLLAGIVSLAFVASSASASPARAADGSEEHRHHGAPEIDPSLAGAGIVLLIGGTLVLTGRRRPATN